MTNTPLLTRRTMLLSGLAVATFAASPVRSAGPSIHVVKGTGGDCSDRQAEPEISGVAGGLDATACCCPQCFPEQVDRSIKILRIAVFVQHTRLGSSAVKRTYGVKHIYKAESYYVH